MASTPLRIVPGSTGVNACFTLRSLRFVQEPAPGSSTTPPVPATTDTEPAVVEALMLLHELAVWVAEIRIVPAAVAWPQLPSTTLLMPDATFPRPPGTREF